MKAIVIETFGGPENLVSRLRCAPAARGREGRRASRPSPLARHPFPSPCTAATLTVTLVLTARSFELFER